MGEQTLVIELAGDANAVTRLCREIERWWTRSEGREGDVSVSPASQASPYIRRLRIASQHAEHWIPRLCQLAHHRGVRARPLHHPNDALVPRRLFRGTDSVVENILRVNGLDEVLWLAPSAAVAQGYIPEAGEIGPYSLSENRPACPDDETTRALARMLGYRAHIYRKDNVGRAQSWRWNHGAQQGVSLNTNALIGLLEGPLGYRPQWPGSLHEYRLKRTYRNGAQSEIVAADYRHSGQVHVLEPASSLHLLDWVTGREGDLLNPDYDNPVLADRARSAGYDGLVIHDFCSSHMWGPVGHVSYAVFEHALHKLTVLGSYRAPQVDWEGEQPLHEGDTPEYTAWCRAQAGVQANPNAAHRPLPRIAP